MSCCSSATGTAGPFACLLTATAKPSGASGSAWLQPARPIPATRAATPTSAPRLRRELRRAISALAGDREGGGEVRTTDEARERRAVVGLDQLARRGEHFAVHAAVGIEGRGHLGLAHLSAYSVGIILSGEGPQPPLPQSHGRVELD